MAALMEIFIQSSYEGGVVWPIRCAGRSPAVSLESFQTDENYVSVESFQLSGRPQSPSTPSSTASSVSSIYSDSSSSEGPTPHPPPPLIPPPLPTESTLSPRGPGARMPPAAFTAPAPGAGARMSTTDFTAFIRFQPPRGQRWSINTDN